MRRQILMLWVCGLALSACAGEDRAGQGVDLEGMLAEPTHAFWSEPAPDSFSVRIMSTAGDFVIHVDRRLAPRGADRFFQLVRAGFFDDSRFYRVRAGFIAQFGIAGEPGVAQVWRDVVMPDDSVRATNVRGAVAYAMTGPGTRTTQIYINLSDNRRLDGDGFAPFGHVTEGMAVVDALYAGYDEEAGGGMRGGRQGRLFEGGNTHLDRDFPRLDRLIRAEIEP